MPSLKSLLESTFKLSYTQTLPVAPSIQNAAVDGQWHTVVSPCDGYGMLTTAAWNPGNLEIAYSNIGFDAKCTNSSVGVAAFVPIKKSRFVKEKQLLASLERLRNLIITSCTLQNDRCLNNAKEVSYVL